MIQDLLSQTRQLMVDGLNLQDSPWSLCFLEQSLNSMDLQNGHEP